MADPILPPGFVVLDPNRIDRKSGAPGITRARVGAAPTPRDRLSTIRKDFPDAQPHGDDNFVYTDPKTGRPTLYNPKGLDWGDWLSILPEAGEFVGGTVGGILATPPALAGAAPTMGASLLAIPAGVGLGAAGGREATVIGADYLLGTDDSRSMLERFGGVGGTVLGNAVGAKIGEVAAPAIGKGIGAVTSALRGQTAKQVSDDFISQGVRQTPGATTGNRGWQVLEKGLQATPGGARVMQDVYKQQMDDLARAAGNITSDIGTATTPQMAGSVIRTGAQGAAKRFGERQGQLYGDAFGKVGADAAVDPTSTRLLLENLEAELAKAPGALKPALQGAIDKTKALITDADSLPVGMETWRQIRTNLGRDIDAPMLAGSTGAQNEANKRLYGALSEDMRATTAAAGPDAKKAMDLADRYTRFQMNTNMPTMQKIADLAADEQAWQYAMAEGGKGGSRLLRLRQNFTPDEWRTVSATVFDRLGLAQPSARGAAELGGEANNWSVNTFLTNWEKLAPEAKAALFGGPQFKDTREAIDQLVRVAGRVKDVERMTNWSGTARSMVAGGAVVGAGERLAAGDALGAAGVLGSTTVLPYITAKMLANPKFTRWLAGAETFGKGASRATMIGRLGAVAEANPEIRDEVLKLQSVLSAPDQRR